MSPKKANKKCLKSLSDNTSEWGLDEVERLILSVFSDDDGQDLRLIELLVTELNQACTTVFSEIEKFVQERTGVTTPVLLPDDTSRLKPIIIEMIEKCREVYGVGVADFVRPYALVGAVH